ncbi:tagaturonate reductase [Labilibaculum sp. K2S]|uniref:tagaturonate reductase n=1 Tax=Labilibaculum sp. K2S TaxID=3056386 RepID=UPI0025A365BF|nr:tagaturonate reductase [Labilibaculum sp. K2S]MDM8161778.1 tagaturonate reductase [Labilibaculum sp. K2S]
MRQLNRETVPSQELPIKILQFGEGNFLRAFVDWMVDIMNKEHNYNSGVAIVQPIEFGMTDMLRKQDNLYHHIYRGLKDGKAISETRLISCVQKAINPFEQKKEYEDLAILNELELVISNTTEAGIVFKSDDCPKEGELASTYPGKLTQLLLSRFTHFNGDPAKGLKFIPVELIDKNGEKLKKAILDYAKLWDLSEEFTQWVNNCNYFANTLVDRIVPGYPKDEIDEIKKSIGFDDNLVVSSEIFHLWVIEGCEEIQKAFPADKCGLNVIYTKDLSPYRTRKVRILNGAHTSMVPVALLNGIETVRESVESKNVGEFVRHIIFNEIAPTINLPKAELELYATEVLERFMNPYIHHELKSIALNSISKYKVRVLPSLLDSLKTNNKLPEGLVLAFTYLIKLYLSESFKIRDNNEVVAFFSALSATSETPEAIIRKVLGEVSFWDTDLNQINGLTEMMTSQLELLNKDVAIGNFKF